MTIVIGTALMTVLPRPGNGACARIAWSTTANEYAASVSSPAASTPKANAPLRHIGIGRRSAYSQPCRAVWTPSAHARDRPAIAVPRFQPVTIRMSELSVSAITMLPAAPTATPIGFASLAPVAGPPSSTLPFPPPATV